MADPAQSAATPVPEEDDFELFGPSPGEASQPSNPGPQPVPTVGPQQAPQPVPQQAPVPPAVTTTVGLDPQLQQLMLNMMQMQQQTLQVMMARMDADERRRREAEAASAAVADPFGSTLEVRQLKLLLLHLQRSNRAEKYLPALPTIDAPSMGKGRVKELEEYHRWCEVLASWLALIDDNYVNELRQAMVHNREIKQSEMSAPVASRSARLFYYLQQSLQKFERGMELVRSTSMRQAQAACGYEVMRQMHATFSIVSRMEAIAVRDEALKLPARARTYKRGMRPGKAVKNEPNDAEPPRLTMTDKEVEKLNQSSSRNSHFAWLVDSGATCHVLSVASLSFYEVVKEHSGPLPVLMSASDTEMECLGLVDIRVKFGRLGPVVLQKVLVCQIGFNVISSWQASLSGWCSWFTATPGESCLMKQNGKGSWVWVPLETEARSWWAMAQEIGPARAKAKAKSKAGVPKGTPPKFGKEDDDTGDAMEVDRAKEKAHPNKHPQRALEVTPFKFLLREGAGPDDGYVREMARSQSDADSGIQQATAVGAEAAAEELVAMNRCDSKELLHRGFHSLTSPALPSGEPPAPTQEGNEADDWGKWKAVPGPPASPPPPGTPVVPPGPPTPPETPPETPREKKKKDKKKEKKKGSKERRAREKDQVAEDKKDHNEGERDQAAEGVALLREQELKMVAASKNLAEKERASAAAKAAANVAVEKWTPQQRARKEAELQAALLAQEQAAATVRLLTLELQLGDALGAPESSAAPEGAVESGTPPELPASRRISLSSSSVEAITPPGTPPTTPVSPGSAVPKTPQRSPLVKAMPKVPESPASQAAVSLVAPAAAGPVAQAAARPAVRVALRPPVRAVQVKAMPKVGQVPDVGHMGPPAPPMVGPMGPVPQAPQVVGKMHMFPPAPPFLGYMGPVPPAPPPGYRGIFNPWSTGPLRQVFGAVGQHVTPITPSAVKSTTANSKGNSSPYAKEERSITFDLRRPVILKVSSSVSSPKKVQECGLSPPEDLEVPVYITSERLRAHRNKGHQPYLSFCDVCQSARGRVPARRKNMKSHYAPGELQVDFGFFGRNVRFLLIVHVLSGYLSTVVLGPEDPVPVPAVCKALSEMGLNGLDIVVHGDQENLLESVFRDSAKHRTFVGRSMHWVPFAVNRPQAKGIVERNVCLVKEAFWSVWLGLEERVGGQLPLGSYLFIEAMRYAVRMHNLFHVSKEQSTPLERLRGSTVQAVRSCEFGVVGFGKPQKDYPEHRGKRLVRAIYVGPHGANGSGIRVFVPLGDGKPPRLEIFSSFRARDPVEFDKAVLDQLKGNREDPERPIKFDVPLDAPQPSASS
ncbi:GIP [Symbiodinium sp. CCMP2592]|nr:GIP [Symbiodinium sp. CCMP2592]